MGAAVALFGLLADAVSTAQSFVDVFVAVYILLIFAYVLLSWVRLPYSVTTNRIQQFFHDVCEPYLRLFRRVLPSMGPIDISPIVAVLVLVALDQVVVRVLDRFH